MTHCMQYYLSKGVNNICFRGLRAFHLSSSIVSNSFQVSCNPISFQLPRLLQFRIISSEADAFCASANSTYLTVNVVNAHLMIADAPNDQDPAHFSRRLAPCPRLAPYISSVFVLPFT